VTGVLAFIPNIGAITSGVLMVAVGFSAGTPTGFYAIGVYFFVQNIDGYLVVPYIARRTVDLPPALVLAMQLLMGSLLGILGVLFADPILATLKVVLVDLSKQRANEEDEGPEVVSGRNVTAAAAAPAAAVPSAAGSAAPASAAASRRRRGRSSAP
jgi:predicted PurR-regulated permease PerM